MALCFVMDAYPYDSEEVRCAPPLPNAGRGGARGGFLEVPLLRQKGKGPLGADLFCFSSYIQNSSFGVLSFRKVAVEVVWNQ